MINLDNVVNYIVDTYKPETIYLFGSCARGGDRPDSDIDLMIVIDGDVAERVIRKDICDKFSDLNLHIHAIKKYEFDNKKNTRDGKGNLIYNIYHSGVVIYNVI